MALKKHDLEELHRINRRFQFPTFTETSYKLEWSKHTFYPDQKQICPLQN